MIVRVVNTLLFKQVEKALSMHLSFADKLMQFMNVYDFKIL